MPHERIRARDLLTRAAEQYDALASPLRAAAAAAAFGGFAAGAQWMRLALETMRGRPCFPAAFNYHLLGLIKYGLAAGVALLWAVAACAWLSRGSCRWPPQPFMPSRLRWSSSSPWFWTVAPSPSAPPGAGLATRAGRSL
jgi:hypothetical protein